MDLKMPFSLAITLLETYRPDPCAGDVSRLVVLMNTLETFNPEDQQAFFLCSLASHQMVRQQYEMDSINHRRLRFLGGLKAYLPYKQEFKFLLEQLLL